MTAWRPTHVLVRAVLLASALVVAAVLLGRPDLLVLAAPFAVHAVAALTRRPTRVPQAESRLGHAWVREGQGTRLRTMLHDASDVEHAVVALASSAFLATRPRGGVARTFPRAAHRRTLDVEVASLRWGRRPAADGVTGATSGWAGFAWGPVPLSSMVLTTLPMPGPFAARAPVPHPIGLVGTNPARRPGDGSEFAGIRPFAVGDRLRRIQWPVSLRTGRLHVTTTVAEEDSSVLLLVDASVEVGQSGGVRGSTSSLDVAVRAAGAVAEHYLSRGDRVGLRVLGVPAGAVVHLGSGARHLRRLMDTLARVTPGGRSEQVVPRFHVPAGAVVLVFSPLLTDVPVTAATTLARRGLPVIVVDSLPADLDLADESTVGRLAWRMRRLERDQLVLRIERAGIPVVAWRGPGTLDAVLRRLARRPPIAAGARR